MTSDEVRLRLIATPFVPFEVVTPTGERVRIDDPRQIVLLADLGVYYLKPGMSAPAWLTLAPVEFSQHRRIDPHVGF